MLRKNNNMPSRSTLKTLFNADARRGERYSLRVGSLFADFSRHRVDADQLRSLLADALQRGLPEAIQALFRGEPVNSTEQRPALHWALRAAEADLPDAALVVQRRQCRQRMTQISSRLRAGEWLGATGEPVTDMVCIGIGGSELGPRLVVEALGNDKTNPRLHFIANVDGHPLADLMKRLDPARTGLLITSKSFGTTETMANAHALSRWLTVGMPEAAAGAIAQRHLIAVTARGDRATQFGVPEVNVVPLWEGVGGRFSLWSAVGLPIMLALGESKFDALLAGARLMDEHFRDTPLEHNLPVLLGLLDYQRFCAGQNGWCVVPYDERLRSLPEYLQQVIMESLGKSVMASGEALSDFHSPLVFGATGTRAQHAFFQALHQGNVNVAVDFIGVIKPDHDFDEHHASLMANLLAQATALAFGTGKEKPGDVACRNALKTRDQTHPRQNVNQQSCPGNRSSNIILLDALTPESIGGLLALYEHRVYVAAVIAGINPFDQPGVELGKLLALFPPNANPPALS